MKEERGEQGGQAGSPCHANWGGHLYGGKIPQIGQEDPFTESAVRLGLF